MSDTSGPTSLVPLAFFAPDGCSSRTWQVMSLWGWTEWSETWPRCGMTRSGALYELPTPELPTAANGCSSLLPTPTASDSTGPGEAVAKQGGPNLRTSVSLLPTPQAQDSESPKTPEQVAAMRARGYGVSNLNEVAAHLLPTPTARDWRSGESNLMDRNARPLNEVAVNLLPTPTATPYGHQWSPSPGATVGPSLQGIAPLMATPRAAAARTSRAAALRTDSMSGPSIEQCVEIANGILPREFTSWGELPASWHGGRTAPPLPAGPRSSDDPRPHQLSLDEAESPG